MTGKSTLATLHLSVLHATDGVPIFTNIKLTAPSMFKEGCEKLFAELQTYECFTTGSPDYPDRISLLAFRPNNSNWSYETSLGPPEEYLDYTIAIIVGTAIDTAQFVLMEDESEHVAKDSAVVFLKLSNGDHREYTPGLMSMLAAHAKQLLNIHPTPVPPIVAIPQNSCSLTPKVFVELNNARNIAAEFFRKQYADALARRVAESGDKRDYGVVTIEIAAAIYALNRKPVLLTPPRAQALLDIGVHLEDLGLDVMHGATMQPMVRKTNFDAHVYLVTSPAFIDAGSQ